MMRTSTRTVQTGPLPCFGGLKVGETRRGKDRCAYCGRWEASGLLTARPTLRCGAKLPLRTAPGCEACAVARNVGLPVGGGRVYRMRPVRALVVDR